MAVLDAASILDDDELILTAESLETAVRAVLGGIQDAVIGHLTSPWPKDDRGHLAWPGAQSVSDELHFWYGASEERAAIKFEPIEVADLIG